MLRNNEKCDIRSVNGGVTTIAADRLEDLASGKIDVINGAEGSRPRASPAIVAESAIAESGRGTRPSEVLAIRPFRREISRRGPIAGPKTENFG